MQFVIELLEVIVWPAALVWLGYMFRGEIQEVGKRLFFGKQRDVRARIEEGVARANKAAEGLARDAPGLMDAAAARQGPIRYEILQRLAENSPRAAILETWVELEAAINDLGYQVDIVQRGPMASRRVVEELIALNRLPHSVMPLYQALRELRNLATHIPDITLNQEEAERFLELALILVHVIRVGGGDKL